MERLAVKEGEHEKFLCFTQGLCVVGIPSIIPITPLMLDGNSIHHPSIHGLSRSFAVDS